MKKQTKLLAVLSTAALAAALSFPAYAKMQAGHRKTATGTIMTPTGSPLPTPGRSLVTTGTIWILTESVPLPLRLTNTM